MTEAFNAPNVVKPFGVFSSAAWEPEGRVLHISGHVSQDVDGNIVGIGDMRAQTRQVLVNIQNVLAYVGGKMSDIVKVTVFITDLSKLAEIHEVRSEFFDLPYPASTLVEVSKLVNPELLIAGPVPFRKLQFVALKIASSLPTATAVPIVASKSQSIRPISGRPGGTMRMPPPVEFPRKSHSVNMAFAALVR